MSGDTIADADLVALPKAELHLHLEGSLRRSTAVDFADRYGLPMPQTGHFSGWPPFTSAYEQARDLVGSADDLHRVARELVEDARAQGTVWFEVHVSPTTYAGRLGPSEAILEIVLDGIRTASDDQTAGAVVLGVNRGFPGSTAEEARDLAVRHAGAGVVALGLVADEASFPPDPFADLFHRARADGLPAVPHAGEAAGPQSVRACVELLGAERICHGVRTIEDPSLVAEVASRGICLDMCPTSNVGLSVVPDFAGHSLPQLVAAGVPVSLGSDCPLLFESSIVDEYRLARDEFGFTADRLADIAETSIRHSYCPADRQGTALAALRRWRAGSRPLTRAGTGSHETRVHHRRTTHRPD